jgi:hypothetical protein
MFFFNPTRLIIHLIGFIFLHLEASTLHTIIAIDLHAHRIEGGMKRDLENVRQEINAICQNSALTLNEKILTGAKNDPVELLDYLRNLYVTSDDVILFYFSGHGFRFSNSASSKWPILAFENASVGIQFEEIGIFLKQKQARLTFAFADCCNHTVPNTTKEKLAVVKDITLGKKMERKIKDKYAKLFIKSKGMLMVASAKAGEYSYTNNQDGSLFTNALTISLKDTLKRSLVSVSWSYVMHLAKKKLARMTTDGGVKQHPIIHSTISD